MHICSPDITDGSMHTGTAGLCRGRDMYASQGTQPRAVPNYSKAVVPPGTAHPSPKRKRREKRPKDALNLTPLQGGGLRGGWSNQSHASLYGAPFGCFPRRLRSRLRKKGAHPPAVPIYGKTAVPLVCLAAILVAGMLAGCVERRLTINSEPQGALVYLNDQEVGRSPVTVYFTWYGDYDVVLRKEGYASLTTHQQLHAPWYQWPILDIAAEALYPGTIYDDHQWTFTMTPYEEQTDYDSLIGRAVSMQDQIHAVPITEPDRSATLPPAKSTATPQ